MVPSRLSLWVARGPAAYPALWISPGLTASRLSTMHSPDIGMYTAKLEQRLLTVCIEHGYLISSAMSVQLMLLECGYFSFLVGISLEFRRRFLVGASPRQGEPPRNQPYLKCRMAKSEDVITERNSSAPDNKGHLEVEEFAHCLENSNVKSNEAYCL
ncbi:hypothetical protein F4776DRAFT_618763 [Hypoxylon sp. NC0597]|nr:hypothetical protein F4776DRAFT_618763 [Hypoxylon sp. NC0597]